MQNKLKIKQPSCQPEMVGDLALVYITIFPSFQLAPKSKSYSRADFNPLWLWAFKSSIEGVDVHPQAKFRQ